MNHANLADLKEICGHFQKSDDLLSISEAGAADHSSYAAAPGSLIAPARPAALNSA
jgi:hypothetical protein